MRDSINSTARISALSDRLLTMSQVERMLVAQDAEDSFRILNDLSWASALSNASGVDEFERIIDHGLYEIKSTLIQCVSSKSLLKFLFLSFDLQNAKTSLLAFFREIEYEEIRENLSSLSYYPRRTAYDILKGTSSLSEGDSFFETALLEAKSILEKNKNNIFPAETLLDAVFYRQIYLSALSLKNPLVLQFSQRLVDTENIKRIIRRQNEKEIAFFMPERSSQGLLMVSPEQAKSFLSFSSVHHFLPEAEAIFAEGGNISAWEVSAEMRLLNMLFWPSRTNPLGLENIVLFFFTKLRNAEIIRSILVGKRSHFRTDQIRDMIAPFLPFLPS